MPKETIGGPLRLADGTTVPISEAVRANGLLFISGQLALDERGRIVAADIETQTRKALENFARQLEAGGSALEHVVKVNAWLTDKADFPGFNAVYASVFTEAPPARSTVVSGLLVPGAKVEIEGVALVP